jgi:hypothetical protein
MYSLDNGTAGLRIPTLWFVQTEENSDARRKSNRLAKLQKKKKKKKKGGGGEQDLHKQSCRALITH